MTKIIRVNMTSLKVEEEEFSNDWIPLGGRALIDNIALREIKAYVHPLASEAKLIFAAGFLSGTAVPNSGRLSIGGKSPLTGGIKESNVGGILGQKLARLGIKAIIIDGKPSNNGLFSMFVNRDGIRLESAKELRGLGNYELASKLRQKYPKAGVASIGPCGEMCMGAATVAITDMSGRPSRQCGRGGIGALMGAKHLKALIVDDRGAVPCKAIRSDDFKDDVKAVVAEINSNPRVAWVRSLSSAGMIAIASNRGSLPTRNYTMGSFDKFENISGERLKELAKERGGSMGHACMPGCLVKCSSVFYSADKEYLTSGFEYETIGMMGANLGICDIDTIAMLDRKCDDYGIDTIEIGSSIGLLSSINYFDFGNNKKAIELVDQIGTGSLLGRVLGQGVVVTSKVFGIDRVPAVKGQAMPAHSVRYLKGLGVTFATSPQGADHTAGFVPDPLTTDGQVESSKVAQINAMIIDSAGICYWAFLTGKNKLISSLITNFYGIDFREEDLIKLANSALLAEREFNEKAGISKQCDRLPAFLETEPLAPANTTFDVPYSEVDELFNSMS